MLFDISLVLFSCSVVSNFLRPHVLQHARPPCPSSTSGVYSNSCPLSQWCHPTISSSAVPSSAFNLSYYQGLFQWVSSLHQMEKYCSFSFNISPSNEYSDWFHLKLTGLISLKSKGLLRVFPNTTVLKHQFFSIQHSL